MSKIFVSGLVNVETSCAVRGFPIGYSPIDYNFFGVNTIASGVGLNVALALSALGDSVSLASFVADDAAGVSVRAASEPIADCRYSPCKETAQSVVLYEPDGRRKVYTDLKDMQELSLPASASDDFGSFDAFCLCNINFSRPLLEKAHRTGKPVFCDVHCLSDLYDGYNADFMRYADVLFLSNEAIRDREEDFVRQLSQVYACKIMVVGMGDKGALLNTRDTDSFTMIPSVYTREVVNTVGAGDALFSAFVHFYLKGESPESALRYAATFASYKIGESGASKGFLSEEALQQLLAAR